MFEWEEWDKKVLTKEQVYSIICNDAFVSLTDEIKNIIDTKVLKNKDTITRGEYRDIREQLWRDDIDVSPLKLDMDADGNVEWWHV